MNFSEIDWTKIGHFKESEFPEDPNKYADPFLLYSLDQYRDYIDAPINPSPVSGALARFDEDSKTSRHYAIDRKSDAIDIFCKVPIFQAWSIAMNSRLWGGIGVYFDTKYCNKSWCMLHLDKRKYGALWFRNDGEYVTMKSSSFWPELNKLFSKEG